MKLSMLAWGALLLAMLACPMQASAAPIWAEVGDAGQTPGTRQNADDFSGTLLTGITGTIASSGNADVFRIFICDPANFSATTSGTGGTLVDTQLFLFHENGLGIAANDDGGAALRAVLPAGNALYANLAPGFYLLAISGFDTDPSNGLGLLFPSFPFGPVYGPTGPGGAFPFTGFTGSSGTGTYNIVLTGAWNTPEPTTLALCGLIGAGLMGYRLRRKTKVVA